MSGEAEARGVTMEGGQYTPPLLRHPEGETPTDSPGGPDVSVHVVGAGVDSLYLGYRGRVDSHALERLEEAQAAAKRQRSRHRVLDPRSGEVLDEGPVAEFMQLGGHTWEVLHYGGAGAQFLLHSTWAQLAITPSAGGTAPTLSAKLLSKELWVDGAAALVAQLDAVARELLKGGQWDPDDGRYVSRLDVCVDFTGWVPSIKELASLAAHGRPTVATYAHGERLVEEDFRRPEWWTRGGLLSGFRIGRKSSVTTRIYDKTLEIKTSSKGWFVDVWKEREYQGGDVWRLEVSWMREYLKDVRDADGVRLRTVEQVLAHTGELMEHQLLHRQRLTLGDNARLDRATTHPAWLAIATTPELDGCVDRSHPIREAQDRATVERLVPQLRGQLVTLAVLEGCMSLDDVVLRAHELVKDVSVGKQQFEKLVAKRGMRKGKRDWVQAELDTMERDTLLRRAAFAVVKVEAA